MPLCRLPFTFIRVHLRFLFLAVGLVGCATDKPFNPSFPLTRKFAHIAIQEMDSDPLPLPRPVVVFGGIHDPGVIAAHIADVIRSTATNRAHVIAVSFFEGGTFDTCAEQALRDIDAAFPSGDPAQTIEVDVVGYSMGGLVARYAASDAYAASHGRRLRIARLFTISTPHQGADLAKLPTFDARVRDMRAGSTFLAQLNDGSHASTAPADEHHAAAANGAAASRPADAYALFAYVRLRDGVIGAQHAAPPGQTAWWVASGLLTPSHLLAGYDERILADILRRLREQEPFTTSPPAPVPE